MPFYKIQLKQGKRSILERVESNSVSDVLAFYSAITTMKVTEVSEIVYQASDLSVPNDDFNYNSIYKGLFKSTLSRKSAQYIFHNVKKTVDEDQIYFLAKQYLLVGGGKIDSSYSSLFKS